MEVTRQLLTEPAGKTGLCRFQFTAAGRACAFRSSSQKCAPRTGTPDTYFYNRNAVSHPAPGAAGAFACLATTATVTAAFNQTQLTAV
jgi:hypothetical protein